MRFSRWTNPHLPQTLQIAIFLLYIHAVMGLVLGNIVIAFLGPLLGLAYLVGSVLAALGIANEMKWGWTLGVAVAIVGVAPYALLLLTGEGFVAGMALGLMFAVAKLVLLLHPQSRDHQRIWFN